LAKFGSLSFVLPPSIEGGPGKRHLDCRSSAAKKYTKRGKGKPQLQTEDIIVAKPRTWHKNGRDLEENRPPTVRVIVFALVEG